MVFMEDSERGAQLAMDCGIDVGLHLNFSTPLSGGAALDRQLVKHQDRLRRFLCFNRYALVVYNPVLRASFRYVYNKQYDEFCRLYGKEPSHIDGHQHLHLSTNMLIDGIIPSGARVRRSFSCFAREKGILNRTYRRLVDRRLMQKYCLTDYFFALSLCLKNGPQGIARVAELAQTAVVELMTHPAKTAESAWLMSDEALRFVAFDPTLR
jgi:predicted glycoside hydrolase/deacetylase ChbG (UPF0249 family)